MKIASSHLFVENAADFVDVGYKKSLRLGVLKEDISVIEVSVRLMYMIENIGLIDKHRVSLEIAMKMIRTQIMICFVQKIKK